MDLTGLHLISSGHIRLALCMLGSIQRLRIRGHKRQQRGVVLAVVQHRRARSLVFAAGVLVLGWHQLRLDVILHLPALQLACQAGARTPSSLPTAAYMKAQGQGMHRPERLPACAQRQLVAIEVACCSDFIDYCPSSGMRWWTQARMPQDRLQLLTSGSASACQLLQRLDLQRTPRGLPLKGHCLGPWHLLRQPPMICAHIHTYIHPSMSEAASRVERPPSGARQPPPCSALPDCQECSLPGPDRGKPEVWQRTCMCGLEHNLRAACGGRLLRMRSTPSSALWSPTSVRVSTGLQDAQVHRHACRSLQTARCPE